MESPRLAQRLQAAGLVVQANVDGQVVPERMKNTPSFRQVLGCGSIVLFVKVATNTGINKIIVAVIAAKRSGPEVVYRQLTGNIVLAHAAVSAARTIALSDILVTRMCHGVSPQRPAVARSICVRSFPALRFLSPVAGDALPVRNAPIRAT